MRSRQTGQPAALLWWGAVLLLTAWAYWPGLGGPMLLDDFANLRPLQRLELNQGYAADIMLGNVSGMFGRPVSMASFTLERLYLDGGTWGQKAVGLFLHLFNATLVLLLARGLLRASGQPRAQWCAVMVASMWLTLPLLMSTTLYVVQRMTLLSATFSLLALLLYCRARAQVGRANWAWFAGSGLAVLLAALSKENGLLAVPLIGAVEVFIFGFRSGRGDADRKLAWVHLGLVMVPLAGFLLVSLLAPAVLYGHYQHRDFTLVERLLTEGRVLLDYLAQILWVDVHQLGVYHDDFPLSTGLFTPGSTVPSLLFWLLAVAAVVACALRQRFRLVAFGIAFFIIGHAMESTVLPLELYFEHRNYLPAFGVLFALVAGANQLQERWEPLRGWVTLLAVLFVSRNLLLLGSQAIVWSDSRLLNMEAVNHHPESERALLALAQVYATGGNLEQALDLTRRANSVTARQGANAQVLEALFYCMAGRPFPDDLFSARTLSGAELAKPYFGDHVQYVSRLVIESRCPRENGLQFAEAMRGWLFAGDGELGTPQIYGSLMLLENELERYPEAMRYARLLTGRDPGDVMGLQFTLYLSHVLDLPAEGDAARSKLIELRDRGELTRQETANLALFLQTP